MNKSWEQMSPRERDAWVAENVMRSKIFVHIDGHYHEVAEQLCNDYEKSSWWKPYWKLTKADKFPDDSYFGRYYTTEVEHDYLVLEKVREWDRDKRGLFCDTLEVMITKRAQNDLPVTYHDLRFEYFLEYYVPGDYSHAAYLVLGEDWRWMKKS